ncbi:unnamed protein product [Closterium sp. NIES-54]
MAALIEVPPSLPPCCPATHPPSHPATLPPAALLPFPTCPCLAALVPVHTEREMDRVLALEGVTLIGINNRDLGTFKVDIGNTQQLLAGERGAAIRERGIMVVGESGLFTPDDVAFVQKAGCNAVLVGESLVRTSDPTAAIAALFGRPITTAPGQPDPTQAHAPA